MKLLNEQGQGKFAIINLQKHNNIEEIKKSGYVLGIEFSEIGTENEFFVLRLKDRYARGALLAYASQAETDDPEYAADIRTLADRAGVASKFCKDPD